MKIPPKLFCWGFNCWPPFVGAGIHVRYIAPDWREVHVRMKLRWYNRNYVGSHFGGSLYAMTDPFYMVMLIQVLGRDYIVWDKSAEIDYVAPGKSTVEARFRLSDETLAEIHEHTAEGAAYLPKFAIDVTNQAGEVVARIRRTLYIRLKSRARPALLEKDHA